MKLSALKNRTQTTEIKVGEGPEDKVSVTYMPGKLTFDMAERIQALAMGENPDEDVTFNMLMELVSEWDLTDDNDEQIPVSKETLKMIPLDFLAKILVMLRGDMIPDPLTQETLAAGLQQREGQVTPLHTTRSSERRGSLV